MPWYGPILSPFKRAWEQAKTDWREARQEDELENPWTYRIRAEQRRILSDPNLDARTAVKLYWATGQRQRELLEQIRGHAPDGTSPTNE
jgi:hypothetical protein